EDEVDFRRRPAEEVEPPGRAGAVQGEPTNPHSRQAGPPLAEVADGVTEDVDEPFGLVDQMPVQAEDPLAVAPEGVQPAGRLPSVRPGHAVAVHPHRPGRTVTVGVPTEQHGQGTQGPELLSRPGSVGATPVPRPARLLRAMVPKSLCGTPWRNISAW